MGVTAAAFLAGHSAFAGSATWDGTNDGIWADVGNWVGDATFPGTGEIATFLDGGNGNTGINLGAGVTVASIIFDTASVAGYTIGTGGVGAQTFTLNDTGAVTMNSAVVNNQTFNANITLGTAVAGTTTITNTSLTNSLNFAGNIAGGTGGTAGTKTINVAGAGVVNLQGTINPGGASGVNLASTGSSGKLNLTGSGASTLNTLRATGANGTVTVNNADANITVASSSSYGPGSAGSSDFVLTSGTVAFNGGLTQANNSADGGGFIVNGGNFSASTIFTQRTFNFSTSAGAITATAVNMGTAGFQVNGGVANVTGAVNLAGSNSATGGQVTGSGNLTIGGELILGAASNTRTTLFQVTGGTLTNTDTVGGGIVIGKGSASVASSGELLLTGGTTTTEKITFGLSGGLAGSYGNLTMNGASANLYVGSGGIVKAATNAYTDSINLTAGTLAAKDDWSSSMNMNLNGVTSGTAMTIKAADVSNVAKNISLSGTLTGTGGFTKTGAGVLTLSNANTYSGATTVSAGTLLINGSIASSATTVNGGLLGGSGTTGAVTVNSGGTIGAGNSIGTLTTGNLSLTGTGALAVELNTTSLATDLVVTNAFSLDSADTVVLTLTDLGGNVPVAFNTTFTIVDYTGSWDGNLFTYNSNVLADDATFIFGANEYQISYNGTTGLDSAVTLTVVPEPSTVAFVGLGLASLLLRVRRGRSA